MTLVNPASLSNASHINTNNLDTLIEQPSALTKLAAECFKDIQKTELGVVHHASKIAMGTLSYLGALALPVAIGAAVVRRNMPASPSEWIGFSASCAGAVVANKITQKVTSVAPLTVAATVVGASIVYAAAKVSDVVTRPFYEQEERVKIFRKERHEVIIKDLSQVYLGMSEALLKQYKKSIKTPQQTFAIKQLAEKLQASIVAAKETMHQIGLSDSEAGQVAAPVEAVLQRIDEQVLGFIDSPAYNTSLIASIPIGSWCVPETAKEWLQKAARRKPSCGDRLLVSLGITTGISQEAVCQGEAKKALFAVYNGIARHIEDMLGAIKPVRGKRKRTCPEALAHAVGIEAKCVAIEAEISRCKIVGLDPKEVTLQLKKSIQAVRKAFPELV